MTYKNHVLKTSFYECTGYKELTVGFVKFLAVIFGVKSTVKNVFQCRPLMVAGKGLI